MQPTRARTVLVLGAYGFIGSSVTRALTRKDYNVCGVARSKALAGRILPGCRIIERDLRNMAAPDRWATVLQEVDVVVNCAGALQDGGQDDLAAVHHHAIAALGLACAERGISIVQISAVGAEATADTAFMRTKADGDAALRRSGATLWVLKPGLVIGQAAFGGTGLLRMLAAVPLVQPLAHPATPVQSVGMEDLCRVVLEAVSGQLPEGEYDLVEDQPHSLAEVVRKTRQWLGFRPARFVWTVPSLIVRLIGKTADGLGVMGWRSPLRTTALAVMKSGVVGNPVPYKQASGRGLAALPEIYAGLECAREHRLAARMSLLMPIVVAGLSLFWLVSGLFGLIGLGAASAVLLSAGWPYWPAIGSVVFWSLVDISLGLAILWRPWAAWACLAQAAVAVCYLGAAIVVAPELWVDPLGPLVKIMPAILLSLLAHQMLESR